MPFKKLIRSVAQAVKPIASTVAKAGLAKLTVANPVLGMAVGAVAKSGILAGGRGAAAAVTATHPTQTVNSSGLTHGGMIRTKPGGSEMFGMGGGRMMMTGRGGLPARIPGGGGGGTRDIVSAARSGGGGMVAKDGVIRGIVALGGKYLTNRKVVALAKRIGLEAAAAALGISVLNIAQMIATDASRPTRRRRGITWRELNTTRRTMRRLASMSCYVSKAPTRRKTACR